MNIAIKCVLGVLAIGLSPQADALDVLRTNGTGPVGNCQAALPAFEGQTRKRPLAVVNESTGTAFVTCAFTTEEVSLNVQGFSTRVSNLSSVEATINCTAVVGDELQDVDYIAKSITLAPGADGTLSWNTLDNSGVLFVKSVALSCALPSFTGLNRNRITTLISLL